jgi:lipid II:glycine glycyltransferase (peptidoglycan interpeptide bridge formation enzyme)
MNTTLTPSPDQWDSFVSGQPRAHVLQQSAWGTLKSRYGWECERVAIADESGQIVSGAQLLFRRLPFGLGTMAYLPMGPLGILDAALWRAVHAAARRHRAAFLKWEPGLALDDDALPDPRVFGFRPSQQTIQPPRTILIDLSGSDEAILARMNQGTRRKIRQSQKNDILYQEAAPADLPLFTGMMQTTGTRNAFGVHEPDYYTAAYELFVPQGHAALILATHEGDPLAGIMVFALGSSAWYLYGASSDTKRNLMAAYGVQWAAIQWAKAKDCRWYDMWGIPDADEAALEAQFESRSDGLWGVYGFKRGWGGRVVRSLGAWDHVYNPLLYAAYQLALRVRR